ncbi:MAG: 3'-5' exonuclease, partial [Myxococcota bacterium]
MLVARTIQSEQRTNDLTGDAFAILYRQNAQSRAFEEAFRRLRVPFRIVGGTGFYERKEVKDILSYLRVTANPRSRQDFERIVNVPSRKIGATTIKRLRAAGEAEGLEGARMLEASDEAMKAAGLGPAAIKKLRAVGALLSGFTGLSMRSSATEVAIEIIESTGYLNHLRQSDPSSADDRIANVQELVSSISEHEVAESLEDTPDEGPPKTPLQAFLDRAALSASETSDEGQGVTLMTLHAAKGLEFPVVFMVGMEEMTFPSRRAIDDIDPGTMEEERRLCYVGMTRAMKRLYLSAARYRRFYGQEEVRSPSRFLGELPDKVVGNFPELSSARRWARAAEALREEGATAPTTDRGGDRIEYDEGETTTRRPKSARSARSSQAEVAATTDEITAGAFIDHNLFGRGLVKSAEGSGPKARLTIEFPNHGIKKVI